MTRRIAWLALAVVTLVALAVGASGERGPRTENEQVDAIASTVRCPTCRGLSAAESDAVAAQAVRDEIREQLRAGSDADEIRAFLAGRYGDDILLTPPREGLSGLVWALPVTALVLGLAGLVVAFRRWRASAAVLPTPEDRALVEEALHR